jgi:hypothetical protein
MTTISKLALIAAITAVGIASPAFAQSFDPEFGTGNVLPFSIEAAAPHAAVTPGVHGKISARARGLHSFAMVPGSQPAFNSADPALAGGGSAGYNKLLETF